MRYLCVRGLVHPPAVFVNATDVLTGGYFSLGPTSIKSLLAPPHASPSLSDYEGTSIDNGSVSQMVHISARFPFLSPAAPIAVDTSYDVSSRPDNPFTNPPKTPSAHWVTVWTLVDGGYFDNTGLTPTSLARRTLGKVGMTHPTMTPIHLDSKTQRLRQYTFQTARLSSADLVRHSLIRSTNRGLSSAIRYSMGAASPKYLRNPFPCSERFWHPSRLSSVFGMLTLAIR